MIAVQGHEMDGKADSKLAHLKDEEASPHRQSSKRWVRHQSETNHHTPRPCFVRRCRRHSQTRLCGSGHRSLEDETEAKPDVKPVISPSSPARASKPLSSGEGGSASKKPRTGGSMPTSASKGQKTLQSYFKKT